MRGNDAERLMRSASPWVVSGGDRPARTRRLNDLALDLEQLGSETIVITADLGLPFLGPPGAVSRFRRKGSFWIRERVEPLCTLDAARFRLPLLLACQRAFEGASGTPIVVDVPSLTRGMSAAELLAGIVAAVSAKRVLSLGSLGGIRDEIEALGAEVIESEEEKEPPVDRERERTEIWNAFLENAPELSLESLPLVGAPPPRNAPNAFAGRQVALLGRNGEALGFGEVLSLEAGTLRARVQRFSDREPRALLVRDARRDSRGFLSTDRLSEPPSPAGGSADLGPGSGGVELHPPVLTLASAKAFLVNGVFGDPLLHVRLRHRKRSLLFDLGETTRLPARIVHQVTDVFISHAHFDHIGGFLWLLRSSIGSPRPRSLYGPPGLADHVEGMMGGIQWDRIGDRGPVFVVHEVHSARLARFRLQAGRKGRAALQERALEGDALLEEPDFRVRAVTLDHGIPVLAFAFEETRALHVRPDALAELRLTPGPWLSFLKRLLLEDRGEELVPLPDGSMKKASDLESALLYSSPGQKLAYATDLDETEANESTLSALASGARVFFCEASFVEEDRELARASQHLTAKGCARIASSARVEKLVPFHFSKRYEHDPGRVYREIVALFPATVLAR